MDYSIDDSKIIEQVLAHMKELGIPPAPAETLTADGQLHRYHVDGDKHGTKNGAYKIHTDGVPAWYIHSYHGGISATGKFTPDGLIGVDADTYHKRLADKEYMKQVERAREITRQRERERQVQAVKEAQELYNTSRPATADHEYIKRKRIENYDKFREGHDGELLIPLYKTGTGEFQSLQRIFPNGDKRFYFGTQTTGAYFEFEPVSKNNGVILVAEGIATAETVYRLTGKKYRVFSAMNCGNLHNVTAPMKQHYTQSSIIVFADNDHETEARTGENPGRLYAETEVKSGRAKALIIPEFAHGENGSDWNDYEAIHGSEATAAEITRQLDAVLSDKTESEPEQQSDGEREPEITDPSLESPVDSPNFPTDADRLNDFLAHVVTLREAERISTGFPKLDEMLNGGLYAGLYTVGANTGFGKTLFAVQLVNNIARAGHGVLIISLEMSAYELMARSLSRESFLLSLLKTGSTDHALTFRDILQGNFEKTAKSGNIIEEVMRDYAQWGANVTTIEGIGDVTASKIREAVTDYTARHEGKQPVLLVDYVQLVASPDSYMSDKQKTDYNVLELKRISRDFAIPVIIVSSLNRENYNEPISTSALKESGSLEYSSDVVVGLQIAEMRRKESAEKDAAYRLFVDGLTEKWRHAKRSGEFAPMELKILKHRAGNEGSIKLEILYRYYCAREVI